MRLASVRRNLSRLQTSLSFGAPRDGTWSSLLAAAAFMAFVMRTGSYARVFEFDPDEGNNLIKSLLLHHGHAFFRDIWSDQPPLLANLLWGVGAVFGFDVAIARLVVLAFAGMMVFALYDVLRLLRGHVAALTGSLLLVVSTQFVQLSVSVMIGLPSVALMTLGVWALVRFHEQRRAAWLCASGVLMALSVATKMFTAFLVPLYGLVVVFWTLLDGGRRNPRLVLRAALLWGTGFAAAFVVGMWPALAARSMSGMIHAHELARESRGGSADGLGTLLGFLREDAVLYGLAALGLGRALLRSHVEAVLWGAWLALAFLTLRDHYPVWPHHRLLLAPPAAALAGYAVGALVGSDERGEKRTGLRRTAELLVPVGFVAFLLYVNPSLRDSIQRPSSWTDSAADERVLAALEPYRGKITSMVTARQMYAYRLGAPVPPNLAVTSYKRIQTGLLRASDIAREVKTSRPEVLVLSKRWGSSIRREVRRAAQGKYQVVYRDGKNGDTEVFVRNDVVVAAPSGDK